MAFDPITAVVDLIKTGLDKFVPTAMSESDKEKLKADLTMHVVDQANTEESTFRTFVIDYEGSAEKVPVFIITIRALIRPLFTVAVGYFDFLYFYFPANIWAIEKVDLLKAINLIVLIFWFGEKAIANSGIIDVLKNLGKAKA